MSEVDESLQDNEVRDDDHREQTTVDGRDPVVTEHISTGEDRLPEGTRSYRYLVDLRWATVIAVARDVEGVDYDQTRSVLDDMVRTVTLVTAE